MPPVEQGINVAQTLIFGFLSGISSGAGFILMFGGVGYVVRLIQKYKGRVNKSVSVK